MAKNDRKNDITITNTLNLKSSLKEKLPLYWSLSLRKGRIPVQAVIFFNVRKHLFTNLLDRIWPALSYAKTILIDYNAFRVINSSWTEACRIWRDTPRKYIIIPFYRPLAVEYGQTKYFFRPNRWCFFQPDGFQPWSKIWPCLLYTSDAADE